MKDEREIARMLKGFGWNVHILENPDGKALENLKKAKRMLHISTLGDSKKVVIYCQ